MKKLVYGIDQRFNLVVILFLFWAVFWLLNGLDKFFKPEYSPTLTQDLKWARIMDNDGKEAYTIHKSIGQGWFGKDRDSKMKNYFARLHMPASVAIINLYVFGIVEIVLGLMFGVLFLWGLSPKNMKKTTGSLIADRTIHRLAFKGSVMIFVCFCAGDILFGDRMELWEHGTFIVLCVITYDMWYRTDRFLIESNKSDGVSSQAASY